jgi:hypothetical protein
MLRILHVQDEGAGAQAVSALTLIEATTDQLGA